MKEENQHIISDEQLFRYFSGDISSDEKLIIDNWSISSETHKLKLEEVRLFYLDIKALQSLKNNESKGNADAAWKKIKSKRALENKGSVSITQTTLKYAASILIVLLGSWFVYNSQKEAAVIFSEVASNSKTIEKTLKDGSIVTLNRNSAISYPDVFDEKERNVLLKGEAHFDITSNPNQPFVISTQNATIKVLGTSFNVDSKFNIDSIVVTVESGKVLFSIGNQQEVLLAGNTGVYVKSNKRLYQMSTDVDLTYNFWRTKKLVFNNTSLSEVIDAINIAYNKNIQLSGNNISSCKISVDFIDEELSNIIDIISTTLNLEVIEKDGSYILNGEGCD